jgi:hypothetical protein
MCLDLISATNRREANEIFAILPGRPSGRLLIQLIGMPQQFRQVLEWIYAVQLAGVDEASFLACCFFPGE